MQLQVFVKQVHKHGKLSKKGTDPCEASPRAKTGLSLFLRPYPEAPRLIEYLQLQYVG